MFSPLGAFATAVDLHFPPEDKMAVRREKQKKGRGF
jgi:hypothetical protein